MFKLITLNIAHRDDLEQDYSARIQQIAQFLDEEQADIVCLQALSFAESESQADEINPIARVDADAYGMDIPLEILKYAKQLGNAE